MDSQTITQTINVLVGPGVPSTGIGPTNSSPLNPLTITVSLLTILIASLLAYYFLIHRSRYAHNSNPNPSNPNPSSNPISKLVSKLPSKLVSRSFSILVLLTLITALLSHLPIVSAAPSLSLDSDQTTIQVTVPQGGGSSSATTTLTTGTANADGYTLTAALSEPEPGIGISLTGGDIASSTPLGAGSTPLTLKATTTATTNDTTDVTLTFTIDASVTSGTKQLKLAYAVADNEVQTATTLQSFTASQCNALTTYDGSNEEAVITLTDTRGDNQTYQVARLADNNCWMLGNLKLGSTTSSLTLTPQDSDIATNFTLPQLTTSGSMDPDNPGAYGPVPGDTGTGQTNYGYLYNWPAATAGESRTSHTETDGDAPYSICPANWRLPTVGFTEEYDEIEDEYSYIASGDYSNLDIAFGGTGQYADSGVSIAKWQHDGPFKGVLAGGWDEGFGGQGGGGYLWSRSAFPGNVDYAGYAYFNASEVLPDVAPRGFGLSVRCLLQQQP